jgi:hypothetical protein
MTQASIDNTFLDWARGTGQGDLELPRSVSSEFAQAIGQDIQSSFRKSEYLV